jgi:3-methyladenine DNA glycosylase Tag
MRGFDEIFEMAAARVGGRAELEKRLAESPARTHAEIARVPDDRILSEMSRRVFQAGFNWKVVDAKWDGFEQAFEHFDPRKCAAMSEERFEALLKDKRIIRNGAKLRSVVVNAGFVLALSAEHGGAARFFADWPSSDFVGLLRYLKDRADRLGGQAAMRFLRSIGLPAFILTESVVGALIREGVVTKEPTGKADLAAVQSAFNAWSAQSGRDLTAISRVLAMTFGETGGGGANPNYITRSLT